MRPADAIPDAPVYTATMAEMENLEELLARANELALQYGAVRIDPPAAWAQPSLRMSPKSRFFVRMQTLPASPFVDPEVVMQANALKHQPRKRTRRKPHTFVDEDSDEPVVVPKDPKTASRDRAARAALRSQRNHHQRTIADHQILADHVAKADFDAARTPPNPFLELPPNPTCTPATSPPPEMNISGPRPLVKQEPFPTHSVAMGQSFARPILPRIPASQIQPSNAPTGQSAAVREAALRLAEAFTGFAKADPAPNAPAIPPCPFSQQTAREHMARRTTEDQPRFPLLGAPPVSESIPGAAVSSILQTNDTQANIGSAREGAQNFMRIGEIVHSRDGVKADHNAEIKNEKSLQGNGRQDVDVGIHPPEQDAKIEGHASAAVKTSTGMMNSCDEYLGTKNNEANIPANWKMTQSPQIIPTSRLAFHGLTSKTFSTTSADLKRTACSAADAMIPVATKPGEVPCDNGCEAKNLQVAMPPAPFVSCPANLPALSAPTLVPAGNQGDNVTEEPHHPPTAVRAPVREFERRGAVSSQRSTGFRPCLRSVLPPVHVFAQPQPKALRIANLIHPPIFSSKPKTARTQGGEPIGHPQLSSPGARPKHLSFPVSCHKRNDLDFSRNATLVKRDCGMVPLANMGPMKTSLAHIDRLDGYKQAHSIAKVEPYLCVPSRQHEEQKSTFDEKQSTLMKPEGIKLPDDVPFYVKGSHEPAQKYGRSHCGSAIHVGIDSESLSGQSKQTFANACSAIPLQNVNKGATPQLSLQDSLGGNRERECPASYSPCKAEPDFAKQSKILSSEPAPKSSNEKATYKAVYRGTAGLTNVTREFTKDAGRELVEEILAAATRSADIPFMKSPQAKTDQEQTTNHGIYASRSSYTGSLYPSPIQDVSQTERLNSDKRMIDAFSDIPAICKQNEDVSLAPRVDPLVSIQQQRRSHPPQSKESAVEVEELVIVREKGVGRDQKREPGKRSKSVPIIDVDARNAPVVKSKDHSSYVKPPAKRNHKRRMESRYLHIDQDDVGRLTKAIIFPDSATPISLAAYEKKAHEHHNETKVALNRSRDDGTDAVKTEHFISNTDMHDVDALEVEFWNAMTKGIRGNPITVAYGVDVEAEGAFDSSGMSYVEWCGADPTRLKPSKRKKGRPRKPKGSKTEHRPGSTGTGANNSINQAIGSRSGDPHDDADDEMEYDDEKTLGMRTAREGRGHALKEKVSPAESIYQRNKSTGPRCHVGTLNRDGLLRHLPRMPGINHSMYYVGQLFTRFCWHTEDAFLNSVSYLHPGSAEKVWYAVPPRFAPAFEEYASSYIFSPNLLNDETAGQVLLMNKTTMFDPRGVRRKGVLVYRVVHKPGSFVLTAPRAYHAGFNCGFNIAEAVNFANPSWFPVGRAASSFARQTLRPLCVPWEYLLFHEAKAMRDMGQGAIKRATSTMRLTNNAKVVARELKAIIMDGEVKIRKYAEAQNCRVSMLNEVDGLAKNNQVGPEFGNGAGMVCSLCAHTCHFYAEMCGSCDDSFEARCVDHFGKGHRLCLKPSHKTVIVRRHDPVLLLDILGYLEKMAKIEVDSTEQARRYLGYIRPWQTPLRSSGLRLRLDLKAAASRLPPKVSKEKGNREKAIRDKVNRDKTNRDKRRKPRKSRGMFSQGEMRSKRGMFPQVEGLAEVDFLTSSGVQHEIRSEGESKLDGVVDLTRKIPLLR